MTKKKLILIVLLFVVVIGTIFVLQQKSSNTTTDSGTGSGLKTKEDQDRSRVADDGTPVTNVEARQQSTAPGAIKITNLSQDETTVYVRTLIDGVAAGTCNLEMTSGSKKITRSAPVIPVTSYYACEGFNIPKQEISAGSWKVVVRIDNGAEATKEINLN